MLPTYKTSIALLLFFNFNLLPAQNWFIKSVNGSGNKTTQVIQTENYDVIQAQGPIEIHLQKGKEGKISVTASDNLHQYLKVESVNNQLKIRLKKGVNIRRNGHFKINIPFESLSKIGLSGSGVIHSKDPIKTDLLEVSLSGSGDVNLPLATEKTEIAVSGSGDIELAGTSTNLNLKISGSADFEGLKLDTQNTSISISGSGDAKVVASRSLMAKISGSGSVVYKGRPEKVNTKISGSGSIKTIDKNFSHQ
ncbi:MAG: head GIN domain-containing protein [Flavobacteriaceae bacterium]|jgi:hypothetical protein